MKTRTQKYPLRKIIDWYTDEETGATKEILECGHIIGARHDIYGRTNAYKRRCHKCGKQT